MSTDITKTLIDIKIETYLIDLRRGRVSVSELSESLCRDIQNLPMTNIAAISTALAIYMSVSNIGPKCRFQLLHTEKWTFKDMAGNQCKGYIPKARWDGKPKRCPNEGEYYISGAIPSAWIAPCNMTTEYYIAERIT